MESNRAAIELNKQYLLARREDNVKDKYEILLRYSSFQSIQFLNESDPFILNGIRCLPRKLIVLSIITESENFVPSSICWSGLAHLFDYFN